MKKLILLTAVMIICSSCACIGIKFDGKCITDTVKEKLSRKSATNE